MPAAWWLRIEVVGATWTQAVPGPAVRLGEGKVVDLSASAHRRGVRLGMTERQAVLQVPDLLRQPLWPGQAAEAARRVAMVAQRLDEGARPLPPIGAEARFLPVAASALDEPWKDLCGRMVPRLGWRVEGAASFAPWAAAAVLRAARAGLLDPAQALWAGGRGTGSPLWVTGVDPLPVDCLGPMSPSLRQALRRRGLERIGQVRALSPAARRLLPGGGELFALLGEAVGSGGAGGMDAVRVHRLSRCFDPPLEDRLSLERALEGMAGAVAAQLLRSRLGVQALAAAAGTEQEGEKDGWQVGRRLPATALPSRLPGLVRALAQTPPGRPVARLDLRVEAVPLGWDQARLDRPAAREGLGMAQGLAVDPARLRREERLRFWDPLRARD